MIPCALIISITSTDEAILYQVTVDLYPESIPQIGHKICLGELVEGKELTLVVSDVRHYIAKNQSDNFTTVVADQLVVELDAVDLMVGALKIYFEGKIQSIDKHEDDWYKDAVKAFKDEQHPLHNAIKKKLEACEKEFNLVNAVEAYQIIIELPKAVSTN